MAIQSIPGPVALASNADELTNQEVCQTMQEVAPRSDVHKRRVEETGFRMTSESKVVTRPQAI